jgi:uncharacterized surface protein with fasciclin (FAS1) repeats
MKMKLLSTLLMMVLLVTACGEKKEKATTDEAVDTEMAEMEETMEETMPTETIVGVASSNDSFSTLVAAVGAADLVGTLGSDGPFTVFAPTNESFEKLPVGTVEGLLKPENKAALINLLTYHVVSGNYPAAAVVEAINANDGSFVVETVQGGIITLSLDGESVVLTDAKGNTATVIIADVPASNGVIHAIDTVIMPAD